MTISHYALMELEQSDLGGAIDRVRAAPLAFVMEVAQDTGYSPRLRLEACKVALRLQYGPPPGGPIVSDDDPRMATVHALLAGKIRLAR
jgi:hypothetical protein